MVHLQIQTDKCIGCGLCASVCIRNAIIIKDWKAQENPDNLMGCFDCGHCMAICPNDVIRLVRYADQTDKPRPYKNKPTVTYDNLITFLSERRSMRWMTNEPVSKGDFSKLFAAAHYSPTSMNQQDVRFVVLDKELDAFLDHITGILRPLADQFPRIKQFIEYMEDKTTSKYNPFLWEGRQVILAFSKVRANAFIAMSRVEMAAATLGLLPWIFLSEVRSQFGSLHFHEGHLLVLFFYSREYILRPSLHAYPCHAAF